MDPVKTPSKPERSRWIWLAAGLLVVVLAVLWLRHGKTPPLPSSVATEGALANAFTPTADQWAGFRTATIGLLAFHHFAQTDGMVATDDDLTTAVYSPYTGLVTKVFAKVGDTVKAGDPLLAMRADELVQAVNDLVAASAGLRTARAALLLARNAEARQHMLYSSQGAALKDWQQSQADLATAQGAYASAQVALGAVYNRLRIFGKSEAEIATLEQMPDPTRFSPVAIITAPIGGIVTQRQVGPGQNVISQGTGGLTALFSVGDLSRVWLVAQMREADAAAIHLGDLVEARLLAFPDRVFTAHISAVGAAIDPNSHRLAVHADIDNPGGLLKPQMFANFRIFVGAPMNFPAVPQDAVVYEGEDAHVWLVNHDKSLSLRQLRTGVVEDGMVQVLSGLQKGDIVVTRGALFIDREAAE